MIVLVGSYVDKWFKPSSTSIIWHGQRVQVYSIPHPEYLKRWAKLEYVSEVNTSIQQMAVEDNLKVTNYLLTFRAA